MGDCDWLRGREFCPFTSNSDVFPERMTFGEPVVGLLGGYAVLDRIENGLEGKLFEEQEEMILPAVQWPTANLLETSRLLAVFGGFLPAKKNMEGKKME